MHTITHDPDSGVVDLDCRPLSPEKVFDEAAHHIKHGLTFLGHSPGYWRDLIADRAQSLVDEADPDEYEVWNVRYLEKT